MKLPSLASRRIHISFGLILHELLVDPPSIDRIEPYDNPFAPGNLEVLKKISIALRDGG